MIGTRKFVRKGGTGYEDCEISGSVGGADTCAELYGICGNLETRPDSWWYDYGNGQYPSNTWLWLDGNKDGISECYYFDQNGWLLTDTTTPDGYQVNADGQWITYGQIRRVYSTAATIAAVKASGDKTYSSTNVKRNHGASGTFDEETGKRVGGVESPFTTTVY